MARIVIAATMFIAMCAITISALASPLPVAASESIGIDASAAR